MDDARLEESALVVPVPDAEAVVDAARARLDPSAALGVPAHITVLYPFVAPDLIGTQLVADLGRLFGSLRPFGFHLATVRWFDDRVAWLAPEPDMPFREMTELVAGIWPDHQPYGGEHPEVIPHLTIAQDAPLDEMQRAAGMVAGELPIVTVARLVWLMTGSNEAGSWSVRAAFPLGSASGSR